MIRRFSPLHGRHGVRLISLFACLCCVPGPAHLPAQAQPKPGKNLFARENLVAWCIVPYDGKKRGPEERAAMLKRLRFKHFAYDWRAEHLPTFNAELDILQREGIHLDGVWFPGALNADARTLLDGLQKHGIKTQLWVALDGGSPTKTAAEQRLRIEEAAKAIRPIAEEAARIGCTVELYNHGGWFGEPENQLAIIQELHRTDVGIVYNLHHGHGDLERFPELLHKVLPYLKALNLNGMVKNGDKIGKQLLPLGQGDLDLGLLKTIAESGYQGPIGIIGHTLDDAEARLQDNLDGLDWLVAQLDGKAPGPKPKPRTYQASIEAPHLVPVDKRLKVVLIDRSPDEAYLAVKADSMGRLFVGGREAVFVFEPDAKGSYQPRRELYRFPPDAIIIGLEVRGNDLYVLTNNALYLVPDGRIKRAGLTPRRLLWGLPLDLHVSFHCLAWGPEGDLYLDHGDPLLNYGDWNRPDHWGHWTLFTQPEGTKVAYTGVGGVLKIHPDGSGLQVLAGGLRGPVGLAFDRYWNLFTNDNDHESRPDLYVPARLLHVTPQVDFGWPRGWMASKSPDRADLIEPMTGSLGRGVPCDMAYYDDPFLSGSLRNQLLLCRWDRMAVSRYTFQPRGASFATDENAFLNGQDQARPVGLTVGRGGRVFVTSLYLEANVVSPHCPSDLVMITRADDAPEYPFQAYDIVTFPPEQLWADLSNPSWERRYRAHTELLRRGGELLNEATRRLAAVKNNDPVLHHLLWLAGASRSLQAARLIAARATDPDPGIRLQAVRVLAEFDPGSAPQELFTKALADAEPAIQLAGLVSFFRPETILPLDPVVRLACSTDSYLRQTACRLLARRASLPDLQNLLHSPEPAVRLAGVLACGMRLTVPATHEAPPQSLPLFYPEGSPFFQRKLRFAEVPDPVDLHDLGRVGSYTSAERWRVIRPNEEQKSLFDWLMHGLTDAAPSVRLQAAYFLFLLNDPRTELLLAKVRREVEIDKVATTPLREVAGVWVVGPFDDEAKGFNQVHPPEQGVIDLTAAYPISGATLTWRMAGGKAGRFASGAIGPLSGGSSYVFFRLQSLRRQMAVLSVHTGGPVRVWLNSQQIGEEAGPALLDLQPGSNDLLVRVSREKVAGDVELLVRSGEGVVATVPEQLDGDLLLRRLQEAAGGPERIGPEFQQLNWMAEVPKGDAAQGRKLFGTLGCVKCHAVAAEQKGGGAPSLAEARKRFTVPYLVESILLPSRQVAEPFRATVITTTRGQIITGLVVNESMDGLELLLVDATRKTISKKEIAERTASKISPMPSGLMKTPQELRDVLAFLLSDNPLPP